MMGIPGFVDLQINGFKGIDFSSPELTEKNCYEACKDILKTGTIVFLPTVITSSIDLLQRNLRIIAQTMKHDDLRDHIPGIHLEGPFISNIDGAKGAHNDSWIRKPDIALFNDFYKWSDENIKLLTIAAETEKAEELCKYASDLGITVSLGHQMATENDIEKMRVAGARSLTHLGNGLPMYIHRHDNPIWAGLSNDQLIAMIIPDGHHISPAMLKTIIRTKGTDKVCITSDASPIAGMTPGKYHTLGNKAVLEKSGRLYNPESGYLVGSSSMIIDCVNYLLSLDLVPLKDILKMSFHNPLRLIELNPEKIVEKFQARVKFKNGKVIAV